MSFIEHMGRHGMNALDFAIEMQKRIEFDVPSRKNNKRIKVDDPFF